MVHSKTQCTPTKNKLSSPTKNKLSSPTRTSPRRNTHSNPIQERRTSPRKKTRFVSSSTTVTLVNALKKTRSLHAVNPCPSSSPQSVKRKPISYNLQQKLSKKRKRVGPETETQPNKKAGIKLLKRGCVSMHRMLRRKTDNGIHVPVSFNDKGEAFGKEATEMQSYIGVQARTKIPIWYDTWKQVPDTTKEKIWACVQMVFIVPPTAEKMVLKSAGQKWREFKSRLTTLYILPYREDREKLVSPPADYTFIEKAHWDIFVADRISDEFLKIHKAQKERRKKNKYPHRMSRRGYANSESEWSQLHPEMEIDRSTAWILARQDGDGNYKTEEIKEKALEIEEMKQKVSEGSVVESGVDDVLTKVLGNPEHRGRVRGQGGSVKQSIYFHLPRPKKGMSMDDRIRDGVQKVLAEETKRIIDERDTFWAAKMENLKTELFAKISGNGPSPLNIGSQQASCSNSKGGPAIAFHENVKKRLNIEEKKIDLVVAEGENAAEDEMTERIIEKCGGVEEKMVEKCEGVEEKENDEVEVKVLGSSEFQLAVGSLSNIVAYATIDDVAVVEGREPTVHGVLLGKENARVSITRVIQGDVQIPFPVGDEIVTVQQAKDTFIAWPRHLIMGGKSSLPVSKKSKRGKKNAGKKLKKVVIEDEVLEPEFVVEMGENYPSALKRLWIWAENAMSDGQTVGFELSKEAFGVTKKQKIFLSDIHAVCSGGEMSGSVICIYIHSLEIYLKKNKMSDMITFVDPGMIGFIGCGTAGQRSHALADRFNDAKKGQYFLLPYNDVNHWSLTVVNPEEEAVYHMDPLKRRIASEEWLEVVNNGIKLYKENMKKVGRKKITWENMAGVPVQSGDKDCGLFIMRYMKEICEDKELDFAAKWIRRSDLAYSADDINQIRTDFAKFFMKCHSY